MESKPKQREFFKDYETVIPFLENLFYYGTKSQIDFAEEGICRKSKYACLKKTLRFAFGDTLEEHRNSRGQKALSFSRDHFYDPHNAFLRFFALKSFTSTERLFLICFILQLIGHEGKCTVEGICKRLDDIMPDPDAKDRKPTVRRTLNNMLEYGFLTRSGPEFSIALDRNAVYSQGLLLLTDLGINVNPLSVCGSGIRSKMKLDYQSPFLFKHIHLGQVFNDELIWKLMVYIHEKKHISITNRKGIRLRDLLPYRIITNRETGRQYLFAVYVGKEDYEEYLMLRLDYICSTEPEISECTIPDDKVLQEKFDNAFRYSFNGTSFLKRGQEPEHGTVIYDKSFEWNIRMHFPDCEPVVVDENHSKIEFKVNTITEMKPWLRRHSDRIKLIESSDDTVGVMHDELKRWREMYGIV